HDPARLEEIRRRQDLLYRLKSKYGSSLSDVLETLENARKELALLDDADLERDQLIRRREQSGAALQAEAARLTKLRAEAAARLAAEVTQILPELGMEGGRLEVHLLPQDSPGAFGSEEVEFRVSLNRGFEPRPLASVASGGELSRVMLALKTILAR